MSEAGVSELPIPAKAIEAAIRASYDDQPQWEHGPKTFEECYGCSPLEHRQSREEVEAVLRAALSEMQFKVERRAEYANGGGLTLPLGSSTAPGPDWTMTYQEQRLVSEWRPIDVP